MTHFMLILLIYMPTPFGDVLHNLEQLQGVPYPSMEECVKQAEAVKKVIPDVSYVCVPETLAPDERVAPKVKDLRSLLPEPPPDPDRDPKPMTMAV